MKRLKLIAIVLAFTLLTGIIYGCKPASSEEPNGSSPGKEELTIANITDCTNIDPQGGLSIGSSVVKCQIYENLVLVDSNGEVQPELAERWEFKDDTTIVFYLRDDVKFSNGMPLTADDVIFSLIRACTSPASSSITATIDPEQIEKIDDLTVQVKLHHPFEPILKHLAQLTVGIMNKQVVESNDGVIDSKNVVGTGPYMLSKWEQGSSVVLVANENYWGESPKIKKLNFRTITESNSRVMELQAGGVDIVLHCTNSEIETLKSGKDVNFDSMTSYYNEYISFNWEDPRFQDENVRKAICHAVNKEGIANSILGETGNVLYSPVASPVWGYTNDVTKYEYNLEKAKEYMARSSYPDGFACRLVTDSTANRIDAAEIIKNGLNEIGITIDIQVVEQAEYSNALHFSGFDMIMGLWVAVCGDPDYGMYPAYHSTCVDGRGNYGRINDSKIDEFLDKGRITTDKSDRESYYVELQQYMTQIAANCPMWETNNVVALRSNVKGFHNDPNEFYHFATCYFE